MISSQIANEDFKDTNDPYAIGFLTLNMFIRPPPATTNASDFKDARVDYFAEHELKKYEIIAF